MSIKNNLEDLIEKSPYKRQYIWEYLGISRNTLTNWCKGKSFPTVPQVIKVCRLLDVKFEDIYQEEEEK
ncbi:helix-turn-helix transcriptional regulator [Heyndrickxia coagulans]|uniref:helix-turn-helix transcriptional regulator n=1 Tax=Heyndrickxia coagulans TaxID=1398 RepID=UPI0018A6FDA3|nr:helix-turn-helix domain-containing protein [Heyndrickxia coagulans]MBF8418959.1 helix-turn-helix domain-containing protein [Heyndrickxia coagulans]